MRGTVSGKVETLDQVSGVFYLIAGLVVALIGAFIGADILTDSITEKSTHTVTRATGDAFTATLPSEHWYLPAPDPNESTAYAKKFPEDLRFAGDGCDTPAEQPIKPGATGSGFGSPASPWDRITLNFPAGTANDACTITYLRETQDEVYNIFIKLGPLVILLVGMLSAGTAIFQSGQTARSGGSIGRGIVAIGILLFGIILVLVVDTVADLARSAYATQPEYIAVSVVFTFVKVIYIASLAGAAFGAYGSKLPGVSSGGMYARRF